MTCLPKESLKALILRAKKATKENKTTMIVATSWETKRGQMEWFCSGIRAYSRQAIQKLSASKMLEKGIGFGLENVLNNFFKDHLEIIKKTGFAQKEPYRHGKERQAAETMLTNKRIAERQKMLMRRKPKPIKKPIRP
jgi:hypothetical protein